MNTAAQAGAIKVYVFSSFETMELGMTWFTATVESVEHAEKFFGNDFALALETRTWQTVWTSRRGQEVLS